YGFSMQVHGFYTVWVSPFGHPRIDACLQLPEAISSFATSFIGSWRLGILRALLLTYPVLAGLLSPFPRFPFAPHGRGSFGKAETSLETKPARARLLLR